MGGKIEVLEGVAAGMFTEKEYKTTFEHCKLLNILIENGTFIPIQNEMTPIINPLSFFEKEKGCAEHLEKEPTFIATLRLFG